MLHRGLAFVFLGVFASLQSVVVGADPEITAPDGTVGIPNSSVSVGAAGLQYQSYNIVLKLSLNKTNPADAEEGTIRKQFAGSIGENAVHGSDSDENAAIEIGYFFSKLELD